MKRCPVCKTVYPDDANFCPMDAGRLIDDAGAAEPSLDLPTMQARLVGGRFRLGPQIGGHRTGEVFSAEDTATGQPCAVKIVAPAVFPTPLVAQRTERELKQLVKVTSDRVARVLDVGRHGDRLYLAMELIGGVTLGEIISANGPLPVDQAVRLALEIGEALAEAAKLGVIHRDVAPKNVLIVADPRGVQRVRLINFGIPTPVSDKVLGVPEFLSPEQAEGKPVDQRSNIYSLGTLLYYMLVGDPPFGSAAGGDPQTVLAQQTSATPVPPSRRAPVPPELERLILKALEKASSRRHLTLRQLLGELESALAHLPATVPAPLPFGGTAAAQQRTVQLEAPAGPSPRVSPASSKTMVGIGLKDILPHLAPGADTQPDPPVAPRAPAVIVAPQGPEAWATTQPAVTPSAPPFAPYPPSFAQPPAPPPFPAQAPPFPSPPSFPSPPPVHVAPPVVLQAQPAPPSSRPTPAKPQASPAPPSAQPSGARGKGAGSRGDGGATRQKGRFRETMWFKKGELDEVAAEATAGAPEGPARADDLPMEDRYKDDGTLTAADRERLSLHTGGTSMLPAVDASRSVPGERITEREMIGELRSSSIGLIVLIAAAALVIGGAILYFAVLR